MKYPSYGTLHWQDISSKNTTDQYKEKISSEGEIFYPADIYNQTTRVVGINTKDNFYRKFELLPPKDPGDGTVPVNAAVIRSPNLKAQLGLGVDH